MGYGCFEQLHDIASLIVPSASNFTFPQWQLPVYFMRAPFDR
jgi:hypothetical protein